MNQISVHNRARVPAINCGSTATKSRLDRHFAVMGGPVVSQRESADATLLMRELTRREPAVASRPAYRSRVRKVSLLAPLRRLRRTLLGGH